MSGRPVHRLGDVNSGGGALTFIPQGSVYANDRLVSIDGSRGTGHPPCPYVVIHCAGAWQTTLGRKTVFAHNIPINCDGDPDSCGHIRIMGSHDVFAGDINFGMAIIDST